MLSRMKPRISLLIVLSLSFVSVQSHARRMNPLLAPIPVDEKLTKGQLANGLNYYILPNSRPEHKVELRLVVKAGSLNERDDEQGLAHLMEHMAFNGTTHFPKHELVNQLEKMGVEFGADLNAYTGFNETVYILPIPTADKANLPKGMQILEDWAFNAKLDTKDIDQERKVVMEEWRASTQNPQSRVMDKSIQFIAKDSLYAQRLPIGKVDVIEHAPADTLRGFYKRWYRPDLMAVVMVGDVTAAQGKVLIEQHFGGHSNPAVPVVLPDATVKNNPQTQIAVLSDKDLPNNSISWIQKADAEKLPNYYTTRGSNAYLSDVKEALLGQMITRRFNVLIDSSTPPFVSAGAYVSDLAGIVRGKTALQLHVVAEPHKQKETLEALHTEILRIKQHGFAQAELDRAVAQTLAATHTQFLNGDKVESADKAAEYIRGETEHEPLPSLAWEERIQRAELPKIQLTDMNALANSFFHPENRIILLTGNEGEQAVSVDDIQRIIDKAPEVAAYSEKPEANQLLKTPPTAGKTVATQVDKTLNITTWTLSNGVKVSYKPTDFNQDEVQFSSSMPSGFSQLSDEAWKKTQWAFGALVDAGVNGLSKTEVSRLMADKIVNVNFAMTQTHQGLEGRFAPKDMESALTLAHSLVVGLNDNPDSFKGFLQRGMASTANLERDRMTTFQDTIARNIARNDPRFDGAYPSPAAWQATDYEQAYAQYRKAFANLNGLHFTFVGKIDPKELQRLCELYLGSLPSDANQTLNFKDWGYRPDFSNRTIEVKKGKEPLSVVHIGFGGEIAFNPKERMAMDAVGHIMTLRLTEQLREAQGGVYSIGADGAIMKRPYPHFEFNIDFPCEPAQASKLTENALNVLKQFIAEGPTAQELEKFRQARTVSYREAIKTNGFWVNQMQSVIKSDNSPSDALTYETRLNALSDKEIQAVAQKYLSGDKVIAVLKPE